MKPGAQRSDDEPQRRESPEPDESNRPLPWFLIMLLGAMATWGGFYIYSTPGGGDSRWGDQRTVSALRGQPRPPPGATIDGAPIYAAKCVACHQATGQGVTGVFPPLAGSEWVVGSQTRLVQILLHGVSGEIVVKGNTYKGAMPAFAALEDARHRVGVLRETQQIAVEAERPFEVGAVRVDVEDARCGDRHARDASRGRRGHRPPRSDVAHPRQVARTPWERSRRVLLGQPASQSIGRPGHLRPTPRWMTTMCRRSVTT